VAQKSPFLEKCNFKRTKDDGPSDPRGQRILQDSLSDDEWVERIIEKILR
jgi:hypothetical protein